MHSPTNNKLLKFRKRVFAVPHSHNYLYKWVDKYSLIYLKTNFILVVTVIIDSLKRSPYYYLVIMVNIY